jgi:hypothetical protein
LSKPVRLSRFIAQNLDRRMDLGALYFKAREKALYERDEGKRMVASA